MNTTNVIEQYGPEVIFRILLGTGSLKDRIADRKLLEEDAALREVVAHYQSQMQDQEDVYFEQIRRELFEKKPANALVKPFAANQKTLGERNPENVPIRPRPARRFDLIAAAKWTAIAGLLFVIGFFAVNNLNNEAGRDIAVYQAHAGQVTENVGSATQGGVAASADTICNCGVNNFRKQYFDAADAENVTFSKTIQDFQPVNAYENQCKQYWIGWISIQNNRPADAAEKFGKLWPTLPEGLLRQRVAKGLMSSLVQTGRPDEAVKVAGATLKEDTFDEDAMQDAEKYFKGLK